MSTPLTFATIAALMHQHRHAEQMSRIMMAVALLWWLAGALGDGHPGDAQWLVCASLATGLLQTWYAMRADLDARLFERLARASDFARELAVDLDASLAELGLGNPGKAGRDWPARFRGARRLLAWQAAWTAVQAIALFAGLMHGKTS